MGSEMCIRDSTEGMLEFLISDILVGCTLDIELDDTCILLLPSRESNELQISGELDRYLIEILDSNNEVYETISSSDGDQLFDLSSLPSGSFFLNIENLENSRINFNATIKD